MKKGYFLLILLLLVSSAMFAQSISIDWIGLHGSAGTADTLAIGGETISVKVQYDPSLMESIQGPYYSGTNLDKVRIYWYSSTEPGAGTYISSAGVSVSNFTSSGVSGNDQTATFDFVLPTPATNSQSFQLMFGLYGENQDFDTTQGQRNSSYYQISASYPVPSGTPDTGWREYINIESTTVETTITGTEVNAGQPLLGYQDLDWQPISYLNFVTNTGTAELNSITYTSSGTASATDFASNGFGIFWSEDATFSEATDTQLGSGQNYSSSMAFTGLTQEIDTSGGYVFCCAKLSETVDYTDKIDLSVASDAITMDEDIDFDGCALTDKYLEPAIEGHYMVYPTMGVGNDMPFFRADVNTNMGATNLTALNVNLSGTAVSADFNSASFKIWHSSSTTFSTSTATQIGSNKSYNSVLAWTGLAQEINATTSYIYCTSTIDEANADLEHVIKATIGASDFTVNGEYNNTKFGDWTLGSEDDGTVLPVELSLFNAVTTSNDDVTLTWVTETENGVSGYYIYRAAADDWNVSEKFHSMITEPTSTQSTQRTYTFNDIEVIEGYKYWYWLECVDIDGATHLFGPVVADLSDGSQSGPPVVAEITKINACYPNPFNPTTRVSFNLVESDHVNIRIYDVRGRMVKELVNKNYDDGLYYEEWNGKDEADKSVAGGVYFIRMVTSDYEGVTKAMLLK